MKAPRVSTYDNTATHPEAFLDEELSREQE